MLRGVQELYKFYKKKSKISCTKVNFVIYLKIINVKYQKNRAKRGQIINYFKRLAKCVLIMCSTEIIFLCRVKGNNISFSGQHF